MDASLFNEYLEKRYYDQLKYYEAAAAKNQQRYKYYQWILIIFSTLTTILAALPRSEKFDIQSVIVVSSALVTILTAALKTFQYQELWVSYRSTIEQLKPEIFYYKFNVGDYAQEGIDKETTFVLRVEQILNKEHDVWLMAKKLKDQPNQGQQLDDLQNKLDQLLREKFNTQKENQPTVTTDVKQPGETTEEKKQEETTDGNKTEDTKQTEQSGEESSGTDQSQKTTETGQADLTDEETDGAGDVTAETGNEAK